MPGVIRVLAALACAVVCLLAQAQGYPAKAVRLVVPTSAGGGLDTLARAIGQRLSEAWGQQVLVENKPGGTFVIGIEYVARSTPDGYTLLVTDASVVINSLLHSKLPYDPVKDLAPITGLVVTNLALVVNPALPVKNIRELIELAKMKPGALSYASFGTGSSAHLSMEMFQAMAGIKLNHIPYKGAAPALIDVAAGHVQMMVGSVGVVLPQWKAGKVRMLAVGSARRSARYPDLPTVAEAGLPGFEATGWFGLFAPAGTPREAVNAINAEVRKIFSDPAFLGKNLDPQAFEPIVSSPEQFSDYMKSEALKWGKVVRDAKVKLD